MVMIRFSTAANAKDAYPAKINGTGSFGWVGILFLELIWEWTAVVILEEPSARTESELTIVKLIIFNNAFSFDFQIN